MRFSSFVVMAALSGSRKVGKPESREVKKPHRQW
jgi:hypothetical protein